MNESFIIEIIHQSNWPIYPARLESKNKRIEERGQEKRRDWYGRRE
jgi:hypothetical protein